MLINVFYLSFIYFFRRIAMSYIMDDTFFFPNIYRKDSIIDFSAQLS